MAKHWARACLAALIGVTASLALLVQPAMAQHQRPPAPASAHKVAGHPALELGKFDLGTLGYTVEEFFVSGTAQSYRLAGAPGADGRWNAVPAANAPYVTRVVVVRPTNPAKFSGTVVTEWMNVSGGADKPSAWGQAHREMVRNGDVFVGVSAQKVGIEGGGGALGSLPALKQVDPARYASLAHPGDAFSFDIFSQVGRLIKDRRSGALGPLTARRVLATGESQSATFLVTYVNAVDPLARVYDGYLIHSRFGSGASLEGGRMASTEMPQGAKIRADVRVPVLTVLAETDVLSARMPGYYSARQPDSARFRAWEIAGAAHADRYVITVTEVDSGSLTPAQLAEAYDETGIGPLKLPVRINDGPQQHYIVQSAFRMLDSWVATGRAPASPAPIEVSHGALVLDSNGMVKGGIRSPWIDVPTSRLIGSGKGGTGIQAFLVLMGQSERYDREKLAQLYPGGKTEYLARFTASLDVAIAKGFILRADRREIIDLAAAAYARASGK